MTCPGAHWPRWMVCSFVPLARPFPTGFKLSANGSCPPEHVKARGFSLGEKFRQREVRGGQGNGDPSSELGTESCPRG